MPPTAALPREAGSAQASLASRARNVENLHCFIYHGIMRNLEVQIFNPLDLLRIVRDSVVQIYNSLWFATLPLPNPADFSGFR
jgi:hypothetical protein